MQKVVVEGLENDPQLMFFEYFFGFFDDAIFALYIYHNVNSTLFLNDVDNFPSAFTFEVDESLWRGLWKGCLFRN